MFSVRNPSEQVYAGCSGSYLCVPVILSNINRKITVNLQIYTSETAILIAHAGHDMLSLAKKLARRKRSSRSLRTLVKTRNRRISERC